MQSGSFCVAGSGTYEAERVGADAYANELTGLAREDTRELSPLQLSINRLLRLMVALMIPISVLLLYALHVHDVPTREAVSTAVAGIVSLVPEGLVLLASLVFAVAAARVGRRGALVQRLPAVEALAGLQRRVPRQDRDADGRHARRRGGGWRSPGADEREVHGLLGAFAASLGARNPTADALHAQLAGATRPVTLEVPFSSRWKWSGIAFDDGSEFALGAPEVIVGAGRRPRARERGRDPPGPQAARAAVRAHAGPRRARGRRGAAASRARAAGARGTERAHAPRRGDHHRVPAPRGRRGQDHLGRRPADRRPQSRARRGSRPRGA